jgi:hypothetical protein
MIREITVNCKPCIQGKHEKCFQKNCLCENDNHGVKILTLKDGVGGKDNFDDVDIVEYNRQVKSVNDSIDHEAKAFRNKNWDIVSDTIQKDHNFLTLRENKDIWFYNNLEGVYKPLGHTIIEEECQRLIQKCQNKTVKEVTETIRRNKTMINSVELFDSKIINTESGILDPKTFEILPHSPEYYTISKLPFRVNHKSNNLKLWNHILTIIDVKDINLILELIWICISQNNPFKKMFVFKGLTNTQKSTLADILVWIIGNDNVSRQKPESFLSKNSRFGTSKFIGKRMNIASEIGNLTTDMIENLKSMIGAELQNTERKNDNTERYFDPNKFVFLFTTNHLGDIYSKINDNSIITRFQFLIFRNQLDDSKTNGQWHDEFFKDEYDKQTAMDTMVNIVINYKKGQSKGTIPKTKWSSIAATKKILDEEMPIEDKYFRDERIVEKAGSRLILSEIKKDFESFVGYNVTSIELGHILKKNGMKSSASNGLTIFKGKAFRSVNDKDQTILI